MGFSGAADLLRPKANRKATKVTATYRVGAPGGAFDAADNGT